MLAKQKCDWTAEKVDRLRELIALENGKRPSYQAIADELFPGLNARCAVSGKIHRLGIGVGFANCGVKKDGIFKRRKPREAREHIIPAGPNKELRCTIHELDSGKCHAPIGVPGTKSFRFCGNPVMIDRKTSYCAFHHARFVRPFVTRDQRLLEEEIGHARKFARG